MNSNEPRNIKKGENDVVVLNPAFDFWKDEEEDIYERYREEILKEENCETKARRNLSDEGHVS